MPCKRCGCDLDAVEELKARVEKLGDEITRLKRDNVYLHSLLKLTTKRQERASAEATTLRQALNQGR